MTISVPEPSNLAPTQPSDPVTGPPPARDAVALAALMHQAGLGDDAMTATGGWLSSERRQASHTQEGYIQDLSRWIGWCLVRGIDPANAPGTAADRFAASMRNAGLANATRARRLSAASSWSRYLARHEAIARNPFDNMDRPKVPAVSETRGMSEDELNRFLAYAQQCESARTFALLSVMAATACRVSSVIGAQVDGLGYDRGHRVIDMPVKGGHSKRFVLPAVAVEAIDTWLGERGTDPGPLFLSSRGKPLDQPGIYRTVQRVARKAGIPQWEQLSPHSLRHTVLTILHDHGYPTHIIQDLAGHADPRTTRRYDEARGALDRSPANDLGAIFAGGIRRHAAKFGGPRE